MAYEKSFVAVDPVIFTLREGKLKVLLHQREKEPFKGLHELPGGLMRGEETAEETLARKLKEVLGLPNIFFEQFHTFTGPKRDPRERAISIGFIALVQSSHVKDAHQWYAVDNLPKLAFDHAQIIREAKEYLKKHIDELIVKQFLPKRFALNDLQAAYETVQGISYDNRNFRKKMLSAGIVEETKEKETGVSHRPALLYRFV